MLANKTLLSSICLCLASVTLVAVAAPVYEQQQLENNGQNPESQSGLGGRFRNMMSVNVPVFYDMVKQGNSLGINVLSGLVKVERGEEAERSGLVGPRPLSVRVFGFPVYERGTRIRPLDPPMRPEEGPFEERPNRPKPPKIPSGSDDELPIIP